MKKHPIKILQWNARGLFRAKLQEFRENLRSVNPLIVFLSETHWKNEYTIKFSAYNSYLLNRPSQGGGVAILVKKAIQTNILTLPNLPNLEAVGVSVKLNDSFIDLISVYCPNGNQCNAHEINLLFNTPRNKAIIGGDFNSHSEVWDDFHATNSCGRKISEFLLTDPNWTLSTPRNLNTRPNPRDYSSSTIDLTFTTSDLSPLTSIHTGPYWSSDHLPVIIDIDLATTQTASIAPRWKFDDKKWGEWNSAISSTLNSQSFSEIEDPAASHSSFTNAIIEASNKFFKRRHSMLPKEKARPWWTEKCEKATRDVRKAHKTWKESLLPSDKTNLNRLEAIKKKTILAAKNDSWSNFIDNLGVPQNTTIF